MSNVCVITGGGSGMGRATIGFIPKDHQIIITGRTLPKLESIAEEYRAQGYSISCYACDVSSREQVTALAKYASEHGSVTRVIHSAGISGSMGNAETILRINALGTVYINQEFYKVMPEKSCILDVCSNSAYLLPRILIPERIYPLALSNETAFVEKMVKKCRLGKDEYTHSTVAYCLSKNFVKWYVKGCGYKYALKGIRVLSVSPGYVETAMTEKEADQVGSKVIKKYTGLKRGARPEELGSLFASLTDEHNSYLIGVDVLCDGGAVSAGFNSKVSSRLDLEPTIKYNW